MFLCLHVLPNNWLTDLEKLRILSIDTSLCILMQLVRSKISVAFEMEVRIFVKMGVNSWTKNWNSWYTYFYNTISGDAFLRPISLLGTTSVVDTRSYTAWRSRWN